MRSIVTFIVLLVLTGVAFAANVPSPDSDASDWLKMLYEAATKGEWKIAAGLVMVGITFILRTYGAKYVKWFASKNGGIVLNFTMSLLATLGVAFASGAEIKLSTVAAAFGTAVSAAGIWELIKGWFPKVDASNEKTKAAAGVPPGS